MTNSVEDLRGRIREVAADVIASSPERIASASSKLNSIAALIPRCNHPSLEADLQSLRRYLVHAHQMLGDLGEVETASDVIYSPSGAPEQRTRADVEVHG